APARQWMVPAHCRLPGAMQWHRSERTKVSQGAFCHPAALTSTSEHGTLAGRANSCSFDAPAQVLFTAPSMSATNPPKSAGRVDPSVIDDLVAANHILADQGVLDGFGHVSVRHPHATDRYFLSSSKAPAIIAADDIMEFDLDSNPVDQQGRLMYIERFIHGE